MNKEILETQWPQIREILTDKFSNLTEEDIRQINGRYDQLVAKLQQKYGYSKAEAEDRIRSWNFDKFATPAARKDPIRGDTLRDNSSMRKEEANRMYDRKDRDDSSLFKWILGLGIPLLLLGGYFLSTAPETTRAPSTVQERTVTESAADSRISDGLRTAMFSQPSLRNEMQNVQISTQNGVVTLSGTVPSREAADRAVAATQNYDGVRQVIDHLQIR
ncbi:MAG TPA: BON domain-containing protein [Parachlamydiaceae bacterium]|nr:BON domain-containing protein [Parachlamydiaceae bacterium]